MYRLAAKRAEIKWIDEAHLHRKLDIILQL